MRKRLTTLLFTLVSFAISADALNPYVAKAQLTSAIENRKPVDELNANVIVENQQSIRVYLFTQLTQLNQQTVTHRWIYNGDVMADVELNVGSHNWRTWSYKTVLRSQKGDWKVQVLDQNQNVLLEKFFSVSTAE